MYAGNIKEYIMSILRYFIVLSVVMILFGCATRKEPLMSATYVSTQLSSIDPSQGTKIGDVALSEGEQVCVGEEGLGLMETAVNKALAKAPGATYLKNARFSTITVPFECVGVIVEGEAYK